MTTAYITPLPERLRRWRFSAFGFMFLYVDLGAEGCPITTEMDLRHEQNKDFLRQARDKFVLRQGRDKHLC